jgi:hypothetical protein
MYKVVIPYIYNTLVISRSDAEAVFVGMMVSEEHGRAFGEIQGLTLVGQREE